MSHTLSTIGRRIAPVLLLASTLAISSTASSHADGIIDMPEPQVWGGCPLDEGKEVGKTVRTWQARPLGPPENQLDAGEVRLVCGNNDFGFRHIANKHGTEWESLALLENRNWRDVVDMAITKNLTDPDQHSAQENGKWCGSSEIYFTDKVKGTILKVLRSITIVSDKREVVTTFPNPDGCRE